MLSLITLFYLSSILINELLFKINIRKQKSRSRDMNGIKDNYESDLNIIKENVLVKIKRKVNGTDALDELNSIIIVNNIQ